MSCISRSPKMARASVPGERGEVGVRGGGGEGGL